MDFAKRLKKPQTFIFKSELGEGRVDVWEFIDICNACAIGPQHIMGLMIMGKEAFPKQSKRKFPHHMDVNGNNTGG